MITIINFAFAMSRYKFNISHLSGDVRWRCGDALWWSESCWLLLGGVATVMIWGEGGGTRSS